MVDYFEAIKRPFQDAKKLVIGIILAMIPIVDFLVVGYALYAGKTPTGKLPEWKSWGNLFVKGLGAFVISLIYLAPAILLFIFGMGRQALAGIVTGDISSALAGTGAIFSVLLILTLLAMYVIPAANIRYVRKDEFSAAFELSHISKQIFTGKYFVAWLVSMVYGITISAVLMVSLSWLLPVGGSLIADGVATFIVSITLYSLVGQAISK